MVEYTNRMSIPFPAENDPDWWAVENNSGGRMDKIDELICAAIENMNLFFDHNLSTGVWSFDGIDTMSVAGGEVYLKSASGGVVFFAMGDSVVIPNGGFLFFEMPERPLTGGHPTSLQAAASVQPAANLVVLGKREGVKIYWARTSLAG